MSDPDQNQPEREPLDQHLAGSESIAAAAPVAVPRLAFLRALRGRPFALLWAGQTVSRVGDFLYEIALAWWVLEKTGSAAVMGTVLIFAFTPMVIFLLVGGVAVDRFPRVRLMLASDIARGVVVLVVAALAFRQSLEVWHVLVASLIFGFLDAFFQPAYAALVPELTPADDLPSANALSSMSLQLGRIAGPALGAAIIALVGTAGAFMVNGLSFFVSAACLVPLLGLSAAPVRGEEEEAAGIWQEAKQGFDFVRGMPVLWISITVFALANVTLAGPFSVAMPFLVKDYMHAGVQTLGFIYAVFPIGYILGGLWLGRVDKIRRRGPLAFGAAALAGLMLAAFGLPVPLALLAVAALVNGAALEMAGLVWTNLLQELVPGDMLGRVSSIDMLGSSVLLPVGYALAGWATQRLGPATVFLAGGITTAAIALAALAQPAIQRLD